MSASASTRLVPRRDTTYRHGPLRHFATDVWVLIRRSIARIAREPETLADVTFMPVIFIVMFAYVFGGAIILPGHGSYHEYLVGGVLGMGLAQTAPGVAVAVVTDMSTGLIDRFRSLPMSRWSVLTARTLAELVKQMISAVVVTAVGLAIGWRVHSGVADVIAAFAQQAGLLAFLPLTFISSAFVPTQGMPGWLQPAAEWNPMSALAAACRRLFGNPDPSAAVHAWPMQHPELAVCCWSALLLGVFAPLAVHLYRRQALG